MNTLQEQYTYLLSSIPQRTRKNNALYRAKTPAFTLKNIFLPDWHEKNQYLIKKQYLAKTCANN